MRRILSREVLGKARTNRNVPHATRSFTSSSSILAAKWARMKKVSETARQSAKRERAIQDGKSGIKFEAPIFGDDWAFATMNPEHRAAIHTTVEHLCSTKTLEGSLECYMSFLEKLHRGGMQPSAAFVESTLQECGLRYDQGYFKVFANAIGHAPFILSAEERKRQAEGYIKLIARFHWCGIAMSNPTLILGYVRQQLRCTAEFPPKFGMSWKRSGLKTSVYHDPKSDQKPERKVMDKVKAAAEDFVSKAEADPDQYLSPREPDCRYTLKVVAAMMSLDIDWKPTSETHDLFLELCLEPIPKDYWAAINHEWPPARTIYANMIYRSDPTFAKQLLNDDLKAEIVHPLSAWLMAGLEAPGSGERQRLITLAAEKGNDVAIEALSGYWKGEVDFTKTGAEKEEALMLWREWQQVVDEGALLRRPGRPD